MKIAILAPRHYVDELKGYYSPPDGIVLHYFVEESIREKDLKHVTDDLLSRKFDGYVGLVDWSSLYAAYLNRCIGAPSPSPTILARLQDKLLSRQIQSKHTGYRGLAKDTRTLKTSKQYDWPVFVKPRRGSMSYLSNVVDNFDELEQGYGEDQRVNMRKVNQDWIKLYQLVGAPEEVKEGVDGFVAEGLLGNGVQVTLDGYVQNRRVGFFGFTKSVFMPNHISFKRFDYPYRFSRKLERRIKRHTKKLLKGSGFNQSLFNIEYKVDIENNKFEIVEFNTRPSSQFMYPIQLATGIHPLDIAINIVASKKTRVKIPHKSMQIVSICIFRQAEDARVASLPRDTSMKWFHDRYPLGKWKPYALEGEKLSDHPNDSKTYRYAEMVVYHDSNTSVHDFEDQLKASFDTKIALENIES